jgi:hypothetical protein
VAHDDPAELRMGEVPYWLVPSTLGLKFVLGRD